MCHNIYVSALKIGVIFFIFSVFVLLRIESYFFKSVVFIRKNKDNLSKLHQLTRNSKNRENHTLYDLEFCKAD